MNERKWKKNCQNKAITQWALYILKISSNSLLKASNEFKKNKLWNDADILSLERQNHQQMMMIHRSDYLHLFATYFKYLHRTTSGGNSIGWFSQIISSYFFAVTDDDDDFFPSTSISSMLLVVVWSKSLTSSIFDVSPFCYVDIDWKTTREKI